MPQEKEEEFVKLIQDHSGILHKVIGLYVDDADDRADVQQEIMIQAWRSYGRFAGQSKFSTWLYKVALNTVLTFVKKEQKRGHLKMNSPQASTTDESYQGHEIKDHLYRLIKQLGEIDRMIMTLHLDGYQNKEIAEISGMTVNHVNVKLHRLKNQIIEQLKQYRDGHL